MLKRKIDEISSSEPDEETNSKYGGALKCMINGVICYPGAENVLEAEAKREMRAALGSTKIIDIDMDDNGRPREKIVYVDRGPRASASMAKEASKHIETITKADKDEAEREGRPRTRLIFIKQDRDYWPGSENDPGVMDRRAAKELVKPYGFRPSYCEIFVPPMTEEIVPSFRHSDDRIAYGKEATRRRFIRRYDPSKPGTKYIIDNLDPWQVAIIMKGYKEIIFHSTSVATDGTILSFYLQQMLGFFQHSEFALHYHSLLFWLAFMRHLMCNPKTALAEDLSMGNGTADNEKKKILDLVNNDICNAILETSFRCLLEKEKAHPGMAPARPLELWSDDFDVKIDFCQYRSTLLELIGFIATDKPLVAAAKVSEVIIEVLKGLSFAFVSSQDLALIESMHLVLENVVCAIFYGSNEFDKSSTEVQLSLHRIFEGLVQLLISLKWTEPTLVEVLGHYLDALGPFLKYYPDGIGGVINKLFELLTSLPLTVNDPSSTPRCARLQICTSFIRIAKAANGTLLPHMKGIASTMTRLQNEGVLLRAEQNLLGEAFLVVASSAGVQQQQEVLVWLLEPLSNQWTQPDWQEAYLSDPTSLVRLCAETQFMWSVFHTVTFFEKTLKRSLNSENNSKTADPMLPHLSWMLPPLLKLLRAIHSLWSPSITQTLPGEIKAAMIMSDVERTSLLGDGKQKLPKGTSAYADGSQLDISKEAYSEPIETDIRNWMRGIRESGYSILGLSATLGDPFFRSVDPHPVILALMENIEYMEFRHIKQLVHMALVPLVKFCPSDLWGIWLKKLLHQLLVHVSQTLSHSWSCLLQQGKAKVPDVRGIVAGSADLKVEVMEEKLLRDLSREICSLLSVIASPGLNATLPSLEHATADSSSTRDFNTSMVGFVFNNKSLAVPVLKVCIEAFCWTDSEAVCKVCCVCGALTVLAVSTNNVELREVLCKDLFSAIIQGLTLESNAIISADLISLCREIFVYLSGRDPSPKQFLLSLPCITQGDIVAFEEALSKTNSPKEQKQLMKCLLIQATGNKLKALASRRSINVITNVTMRSRNVNAVPQSNVDEDAIGLAAIIT